MPKAKRQTRTKKCEPSNHLEINIPSRKVELQATKDPISEYQNLEEFCFKSIDLPAPLLQMKLADKKAVMQAPKASPQPEPVADDPDALAVPNKVQVGGSPMYYPEKRLGKGGFGQVFLGRRANVRKNTKDPDGAGAAQVAIKFEHKDSKGCSNGQHPHEWNIYNALGDVYGIPKVYYKGRQDDFYIMVMDLLGPSLWDYWNTNHQFLSEDFVACVAVESLNILQALHSRGFVHGDIKPENFLLGTQGTAKERRLYLVDLGLASRWRDKAGEHVKYDQKPDDFRGTVRYASVHAHLGRTTSRRDDLESLVYTLAFILLGKLPWQGYQGQNKNYWVCRKKMSTPAESFARKPKSAFKDFADTVLALKFDEEPSYSKLMHCFAPLLNRPEKPLHINVTFPQVGQKRGRSLSDDLTDDPDLAGSLAPAAKKSRTGTPARQWITVFNNSSPMKQRYHYNVAANRLLVHVQKGWADGLYISAVGSAQNLWAIVMDAGTTYTSQIYKVYQNQFLPKEWIMEKWDDGYYITSVAGGDNNSTLVVMSKGSKFTQQSYKVSDTFPYEWIKKKWKEHFFVTTMATCNNQWAVVMSRTAGFVSQVVELDFQYPSEGIHARWNNGYRITAAAATPDQAAFVLSTLRRGPDDVTQETLRTSTFPTEHVKSKWDRNLFISVLAFGRTVA